MNMSPEPVRSQAYVPPRLARVETGLSIIIPTYREAENIPLLLARLAQMRAEHDLEIEVLFMDDDSRDGSDRAVAEAGYPWARLITRQHDHGLSPAVIDGFRQARYAVLICMDCDLSHPPEKIPQMTLALSSGQEFVLGSRFVAGASTDDDWGMFRWFNSRVATLLARPLTKVRDPMSGFFALRRADFEAAPDLNPIGYKIALELIVKCRFSNVAEVPIHFADRTLGESKLTLKEQLKYIQHLRRLYLHKFTNAMHILQFLVVGASGTLVNLAVLSLLLMLGVDHRVCLAGGIGVSLVSNFLLNRRFTFSYARDGHLGKQFLGFVGASAVGLMVNYFVALFMLNNVLTSSPYALHLSAITGIASGMAFNFIGNRYFVFRKRYVRK